MPRLVAPQWPAVLIVALAVSLAACGGAGSSVQTPGARPAAAPADQAAGRPPSGAIEVAAPQPPPPPPQGVIAGRVTDAVSKAPIARVRVRLSSDCEKPAEPPATECEKPLPQERTTLTGADGAFRFTDLPVATKFVIRASHTGHAPQGYGELAPGTPPRYVALAQAQVLDTVNIELAPEVVLAGIVQDEDGQPFAGAFVEALRAVYSEGRRELVTVAEALSDDRGEFRLSQMPPGQYFISATDPAFTNIGDAAGPLFYSPTFYPSATTPEDASRVTLDPGVSREAIVIKLKIIRPSRVGGTLRPAGGLEMTAGAIELGPRRNDQYASQSNHRVDILPDGTYLFANVPPGRYVIRARGETPTLPQSLFGNYTLEVGGLDKSSVDIEMSPGAIVSGFVEWEGGTAPPADRTTIVVRAPMIDGSLSGDAVTGNLQPDDTFRLRGLLQGYHYFRPEGLPAPWSLKRVEINGADVTDIAIDFRFGQIEPGLRIIFTDRSAVIAGTIVPGTRDVLQGYSVVAFSTNPLMWYPRSRHVALARPTDARGRYVIRGLPPGDYWLAATRDLDEGDIGNARSLQILSESTDLQRVQIREREQKLIDLRPVIRRTALLAKNGRRAE